MAGKSLKTIKQWYNPCFAHYETLPFLSDTQSYEVYHVTEEQICDLLQYNFLLLYGKKSLMLQLVRMCMRQEDGAGQMVALPI